MWSNIFTHNRNINFSFKKAGKICFICIDYWKREITNYSPNGTKSRNKYPNIIWMATQKYCYHYLKKDKFTAETQIDDLWFLYSQKGRKGLSYDRKRSGSKRQGDNNIQVKIIAASDKKQVEMKVAKIGRISANDIISLWNKEQWNVVLIELIL